VEVAPLLDPLPPPVLLPELELWPASTPGASRPLPQACVDTSAATDARATTKSVLLRMA
jgi:hypothetical protein